METSEIAPNNTRISESSAEKENLRPTERENYKLHAPKIVARAHFFEHVVQLLHIFSAY